LRLGVVGLDEASIQQRLEDREPFTADELFSLESAGFDPEELHRRLHGESCFSPSELQTLALIGMSEEDIVRRLLAGEEFSDEELKWLQKGGFTLAKLIRRVFGTSNPTKEDGDLSRSFWLGPEDEMPERLTNQNMAMALQRLMSDIGLLSDEEHYMLESCGLSMEEMQRRLALGDGFTEEELERLESAGLSASLQRLASTETISDSERQVLESCGLPVEEIHRRIMTGEDFTEDEVNRKNSTEMKPEPLQFDPLITKNQMDVWDGVDVLDLDKKCSEPLFQVFMTIWYSQKMSLLVKAKTEKVQEYVRAVEAGYHRQNPYHNNSHAAEVTLMTYQIWTYLSAGSFKGYFEQVDLLVVLLAAAIHDIGHPATNNDFLVKTKAELALRYHDTAVLENFHLATAFQLMRSRSISMLDHNLPSPPVTSLRRRIVEIVLATDMAVHKKQVDDMARSVERHTNRQEIDKRMLEQYIVHTADVGHPFRPVPQHQEWARRVNEEFLQQGDREKELGFTPIEMFDREKAPPLPKNQLGFLQFVIQPLWKPMEALLDTKSRPASLFLQRNIKVWQDEPTENPPSDG